MSAPAIPCPECLCYEEFQAMSDDALVDPDRMCSSCVTKFAIWELDRRIRAIEYLRQDGTALRNQINEYKTQLSAAQDTIRVLNNKDN